jgi:translation initiation factor 2 subunit 1
VKHLKYEESEWPEVGELVIATVKSVTLYGAYVSLDEYSGEGLLHISEISSTWVRNIRNFARENQKIVLKTLRVDPERGHVDLSLRRVSKREKKEKILLWKRSKKAEGLLRSLSEKLKISFDEIYEKAGALIEKEFGLYKGLEKAALEGPSVLLKLGIPERIANPLTEIAMEKIKAPQVKIKGMLELQCTKKNGIEKIRQALLKSQGIRKPVGASIYTYSVSAPRYRVEVSAENYKEGEKMLERAVEAALESISKAGGRGNFERDK